MKKKISLIIFIILLIAGIFTLLWLYFNKPTSTTNEDIYLDTLGDCNCPNVYVPICGKDQITHQNECVAECVGVQIEHEGECASETNWGQ